MIGLELAELVRKVQDGHAMGQTLEILSAHRACPTHLYDTLSAFSNQDSGGIILFGLDKDREFEANGVYDTVDLQEKVTEQCKQMEPAVEPLFTTWKHGNVFVAAAEIPPLIPAGRPCYYRGMGKDKGSFVRNGSFNEPMPEYVIHSYEICKKGCRDDTQASDGADMCTVRLEKMDACLSAIRDGNQNLSSLSREELRYFLGMTARGWPTLACILLFSVYPQMFYPWYAVDILVLREQAAGEPADLQQGIHRRIEGTIPEMLDGTLNFFRDNLKQKTIIEPKTKRWSERYEYPLAALREAVLNALVHRDYSIYTRSIPVKVSIYKNRIEVKNPGGFFGQTQPDTRNPALARSLEAMGIMRNRHSGIPALQQELKNAGMRDAAITNTGTEFCITFYNGEQETPAVYDNSVEEKILEFCETPRSRQEIAEFLGMTTIFYVSNHYINPLLESGKLKMTIPGHPKSKKQKFFH